MNFHLNYTPPKSEFEINHSHKIFLIGSCFSDNMGKYLQEHKFNVLSNPFGTLFNPISIHFSFQNIIERQRVKTKYFVQHDKVFYSYQYHSSVNAPTRHGLSKHISFLTQNAYDFLFDTDVLIITFGSAHNYFQTQLQKHIANCHKQPSDLFEKKMMSIHHITVKYAQLIEELRARFPKMKIIFTVSPVKYLKDGVIENNISKAVLLLSVHQLVNHYKNCFYFPAYELVNDDLRDYRFYKEDLAHPNEQAIEYVWQKFSETFFSEKTLEINKEIEKLNSALAHRVMNEHSLEYEKLQDFISKQKEKIKSLEPKIEF